MSNAVFKRLMLVALIGLTASCASHPHQIADSKPEIINDRMIVREFDASFLKSKIEEQKTYLLNAAHPQYAGYYKLYDPMTDRAETQLRTVYSASAAFAFLKMIKDDPKLDNKIASIAEFLSFMQVKEGPFKGAFHYSYDPINNMKEQRFVVGSSSKAIYTLVTLYKATRKPEYLQSAEEAGHWLIQQVDAAGEVTSEIKFTGNEWKVNHKKSHLYSGQVLSALSRLYAVTKNPELYGPAEKIANELLGEITKANYFAGDDFREPNTISTSWISLSLIDFAKINPNVTTYQEAAFKAMDKILKHQILDSSNLLLYGKFNDTNASSGNGWINEVLAETYTFCIERRKESCDHYLEAVVKTTRWLIQNIYTLENSSHLPNPKRARGGLIRNSEEKTVRTDAVCHSINGMIELLHLNPNVHFETAPQK
ncbi:MAG: hypothetical protein ACFCVA_15105 [Gammaproteobacteria bacterium]